MLTHIYFYSLQYYLPDEGVVTKDFLKDVLVGKKQLFKKTAVSTVEVPHYDELSVKNIFPSFQHDPVFKSYFPDKFPKGKGPPRDYMFNILNTLYPDYLKEIMQHANEQRMTSMGDDMKKESIEMSQFWAEQLEKMPYLSCKFPDPFSFSPSFIFFQRRTARPCTCSR